MFGRGEEWGGGREDSSSFIKNYVVFDGVVSSTREELRDLSPLGAFKPVAEEKNPLF